MKYSGALFMPATRFVLRVVVLMTLFSLAPAVEAANELLAKSGYVFTAPPASSTWNVATVGQEFEGNHRLRTGRYSRATVWMADRTVMRMRELTTITFEVPEEERAKPEPQVTLNLSQGMTYLFSRKRPQDYNIRTPIAAGSVRGTEFNLAVAGDGTTQLALYDGEVNLRNEHGSVSLTSGEIGEVKPGQAPTKSPMIEGDSIIQWCLYYPAVVSTRDLDLSLATGLGNALSAYRRGNLIQAMEAWPEQAAEPSEPNERIFRATLLLSVGAVEDARRLLGDSARSHPAGRAMTLMIAAVKGKASEGVTAGNTASEQLALSYARQSVFDLEGALEAAKAAVSLDPQFGFAHARVAELEFGFGRNNETMDALDQALAVSPDNAQAHAVRGFILAGRNRNDEAMAVFDRALQLDPALGNAWLGRGLTQMNAGNAAAGRQDLQVAATVEPTRSILRSYLSKAFSDEGDQETAMEELSLAGKLDPNDPTVPLYRGLVRQKQGRFNQAVGDIEESQALNDNRKLYRSRLLLDQDQAVRRANLARIYQNAGLDDRAIREAIDAVEDDYTNFSSHLFLANTFDSLRDPNGINQRYETAWFNELLLANLFAPASAGTLSPFVSQQEYSRLFEGDRFGFLSISEYRSDGILSQQLDHSGVVGNFGYSLSGSYYHYDSRYPNVDLADGSFTGTFKYQVTPQDSLLFQIDYADVERGDVSRFLDPYATNPDLSFDEENDPNLILGYNRRWAPGHHTLFLAARLSNQQHILDPRSPQAVIGRSPPPIAVIDAANFLFDVDVENEFEVYSLELQQVAEFDWQRWIVGGAFQTGSVDATSTLSNYVPFGGVAPPAVVPVVDRADDEITRAKGYVYWTVEPVRQLSLTGGLTLDYLNRPFNYRRPPISDGQTDSLEVLPKAAASWEPHPGIKFRTAYAQTRSGVSYDESVRLEPVQLAGFNQAFRTVIPESEINTVEAARFDIYGIAADIKLPADFYLGITAQRIDSEVTQDLGSFDVFAAPVLVPSDFELQYEFQEDVVDFDLSKLIGEWFTVGLGYQYRKSILDWIIPEDTSRNFSQSADLHRWRANVLFNHPTGFYAGAETIWFVQDNDGYGRARPNEQFQHLNVILGYRFWENRGDVRVGLLNLTDDDYRLNPLSVYSSTLPRERVYSLSVKLEY
jgi:tetratricopeptide (TPR) repeat protein